MILKTLREDHWILRMTTFGADGKRCSHSCSHTVVESPPAEARPVDLAEIVAAWPDLPDAVGAGVVAMIRASVPDEPDAERPSPPR